MKIDATFVLLAASCGAMLAAAGCAAKAARVPPVAVVTPPTPAKPPEEPISVPQTQAVLPRPQPILAAALPVPQPELPVPPPEPPAQPPKPRAPKPESRPPATQAPPAVTTTAPTPPRRRIRPVESPAEQHRLQGIIADRQRQAQEALAKAKARPLSDVEKGTVERIQAFLEQTDAALKDQDLQLAEALSSRALLLCRELAPDK